MKRLTIFIITFMIYFVTCSVSNEILVKEIATKVSKENIEQIIKDLSGHIPVIIDGEEVVLKERNSTTDLNSLASKYIFNKFQKYGYSPSISINVDSKGYPIETVYAIKKGTNTLNDIVLFVSNFDTWKIDGDINPGANLNATGISIMLDAARIFVDYEPSKTIIFIAFDGLYPTGHGVVNLLDSLLKSEYESISCIYLSLLGYNSGISTTQITSHDTVQCSSLINRFYNVSDILDLQTKISPALKEFTSFMFLLQNPKNTYVVFEKVGVSNPYMMTKDDTFENLNLDYLYDNARIAIGVLADDSYNTTSYISNSRLKDYKIFPNPAFSFITLNEDDTHQYERYEIYDITGRKLQSELLSSYRIDISGLEQGTYYLRLYNSSGISVTTGFVKIVH